MPVTLYNTLTQTVEPVTPIALGQLKMYVCGVTVYDDPHIGHVRAAYVFEVLRRVFQAQGWRVTYVRNITDVDDKIIEKARQETGGAGDLEAACRHVAARYTDSYHRDLERVGIPLPDVEPKATGHIPQMIQLVKGLVAKGHAYPVGGDVYFRVRSWRAYGRLSHQSVDELRAGARIAPGEQKEDPLDFALWKSSKPGEPAWDSPWGLGRPGWHIECSAMSTTYLTESFDVHGGGLDLVFPHHENEIAQSEAATGRPFVRHWVHSGLVTVNGHKMAKSVGNVIGLSQVLDRQPNPDVLKLLFVMTHYRSPLDFTWEKLDEAARAYGRFAILEQAVQQLVAHQGGTSGSLSPVAQAREQRVSAALADNLNTPEAAAALFELATLGHQAVSRRELGPALAILEAVRRQGRLLGLFEHRASARMDPEIQALVARRDAARRAKDFATADQVRRELQSRGYIVEDTAGGTICRPA